MPTGEFCGVCGAHLATVSEAGAHRRHAYAAHPGEHVLLPAIVSTLLPHLPRRRSAPFRIGLIVTVLVLLLTGVLQSEPPAIAVAVVAVPLLYLIYLYEMEVYEDEPWLVLGLTMVGGAVLGAVYGDLIGGLITRQQILISFFGATPDRVLLLGALPPMAAQLLMLAFPVVLFFIRSKRFDEVLDGFSFGISSGLGFTLAMTFVELWPELMIGPVAHVRPLDNAIDIVIRGVLIPFVNGSATGLICAALWLLRGRRRRHVHHMLATLPVCGGVALLAQAVLGIVGLTLLQPWQLLVAYLVVGLVILLLVRFGLHSMLLAEAVDVEIGPPFPCSHCNHLVPRMAFCPNCGVATRATPKAGAGIHGREVR